MSDESCMQAALEEARLAAEAGEVPVGAVVALNGDIIARGRNGNRAANNPTRHAEMIVIERAAAVLGNERLTGCTLYVTKEPCAMCAGAIVHARVERLVIGASDVKYGACGTVLDVCGNSHLNHQPRIEFGLMADESAAMLRAFFQARR